MSARCALTLAHQIAIHLIYLNPPRHAARWMQANEVDACITSKSSSAANNERLRPRLPPRRPGTYPQSIPSLIAPIVVWPSNASRMMSAWPQ